MKIVTHGGQAHADEILAIALLVIKEGKQLSDVEIIRTLEDKRAKALQEQYGADYIVDVGRDADPRKGWFDHHQFGRDSKASCAFSLVARKYKVNLSELDWAHKLAVIDSKGPVAWFREATGHLPRKPRQTAMVCGTSDSFFVYLASIAGRDFKRAVSMAMEWLEHEFRELEVQKEGLKRSLAIVKVVPLGHFKMAYYDQKDPRGSIAATDRLMENDRSIIVAAMKDERGDGYSAIRMNDNPRVDFSPRAGEKGCKFVHSTGFILKWEDNWEGFCEAVKKSVQPKQKAAHRESRKPAVKK